MFLSAMPVSRQVSAQLRISGILHCEEPEMHRQMRILYPQTKKFSSYPDVRGYIRATNLANLSFREYRNYMRNLEGDETIS